jgi:TrmH family RNA methyltransferase
MKDWKNNIYFVLVEPREPGNVGATARAMKNMGFGNLRIVSSSFSINEEARWFARNAQDVLEAARTYPVLQEAITDMSYIAGTARRKGKRRGLILPVESGVKRLYELSCVNKIAVLFGREDRGLFNEEVDECSLIMNIPTDNSQPSLNLGQAVLLTAYELSRVERMGRETSDIGPLSSAGLPGAWSAPQAFVDHREVSSLFERMAAVLDMLQYGDRGDSDLKGRIIQNLRHFMGRAGLTEGELHMFHGICSQIEMMLGKVGRDA